jgi:hypothetical protein
LSKLQKSNNPTAYSLSYESETKVSMHMQGNQCQRLMHWNNDEDRDNKKEKMPSSKYI